MNTRPHIDVAIQSYRKPESLLYTLLTLKRVAGRQIETVWIDDDRSEDGSVPFCESEMFATLLAPWRVRVRTNRVRTSWLHVRVRGSRYRSWFERHRVDADADDVRYQWALSHTDKPYLFVCHDDVEFRDDVVGLYRSRVGPTTFVVGDLGQCWRCGNYREPVGLGPAGGVQTEARHGSGACSPAALIEGFRPRGWPRTPTASVGRWVCRVNEWSALISVDASRDIERRTGILFGNYYRGGDCAAYWFRTGVRLGYAFDDPLAPDVLNGPQDPRPRYYVHGWQGHSGHAVWVDQGRGLVPYDGAGVRQQLAREFGVSLG